MKLTYHKYSSVEYGMVHYDVEECSRIYVPEGTGLRLVLRASVHCTFVYSRPVIIFGGSIVAPMMPSTKLFQYLAHATPCPTSNS